MILIISNFVATIALFLFVTKLYYSFTSLKIKSFIESNKQQTTDDPINQTDLTWYNQLLIDSKRCNCIGPMISYSFLYFTVLSFGSLMTVYLRWANISDYWVGKFYFDEFLFIVILTIHYINNKLKLFATLYWLILEMDLFYIISVLVF